MFSQFCVWPIYFCRKYIKSQAEAPTNQTKDLNKSKSYYKVNSKFLFGSYDLPLIEIIFTLHKDPGSLVKRIKSAVQWSRFPRNERSLSHIQRSIENRIPLSGADCDRLNARP